MNRSDRTRRRNLSSAVFCLTASALFLGVTAIGFTQTVTVSVEVEFAERIQIGPVTTQDADSGDSAAAEDAGALIVPETHTGGSLVATLRVAASPRRALTVRVDTPGMSGQTDGFRCSYGSTSITSCESGFNLISEADAELRIAADALVTSSPVTPGSEATNLEVTVVYQ